KYAISEGWKNKHKIHTPEKDDIYKDDIDTEIYWLKLWRLKLLERELMNRLKQQWPEEEFIKLLKMKKKLDIERANLALFKKTVITPK
ncbi:MAG: hypothetical protein KDC82_00805, partial [Bacteroidetes bacterium]|nr:hypothetical protein [Bacteroidota bacterium]